MLNEQAREQLAEILVDRIDKVNEEILEDIGNKILAVSLIEPSQAYQLGQILKYGGSYKDIAEKLAKLTGKNVEDIYKIFEQVAKENKQFAKEFYKYRNKDFIPYKQDIALQNQVKSLATITAGLYKNISRTSAIGYIVDGKFRNIQETYNELIDKAIISVVQGKTDYYSSMRKTLTQLGYRGMVQYESGKTRRLDSAIRMNVMDGIRAVNNETNKRFGEEYGADGVEISVHAYPAPDHAEAQGRQLSNEEFDKLQIDGYAKDIKGRTLDLHLSSDSFRPISELNCYHEPLNIVIGISKPLYTDEQLKKIKEDNEKGFDFEGKHYTLYEGTQLQRRLELEAKKHKEETILLRAAGDKEGLAKEELKVRKLTRKYNDLNKASGLPSKKERMSVSGYVRTPVKVEKTIKDDNTIFVSKEENKYLNEYFLSYYGEKVKNNEGLDSRSKERYDKLLAIKENGYKDETIKLDSIENCNLLLDKVNTEITGEEIQNTDFRTIKEATIELYNNSKKATPILRDLRYNRARLRAVEEINGTNTVASTTGRTITLNNSYYKNYEKLKEMSIDNTELHEYLDGEKHSWWSQVAKGNETKVTIVHEFGHRLHTEAYHDATNPGSEAFDYFYKKYGTSYYSNFLKKDVKSIPVEEWNTIKKDLIYEPIRRLQEKTGLTQKEIINKYVSMYGRKNYEEMFAETFANSQLGKSNPLADEFIQFLIEIGVWKG